jgi:hypothetical protein
MGDELSAEREMERLQSMHETVERLRSQLRTIQLEEPTTASGEAAPSEESSDVTSSPKP